MMGLSNAEAERVYEAFMRLPWDRRRQLLRGVLEGRGQEYSTAMAGAITFGLVVFALCGLVFMVGGGCLQGLLYSDLFAAVYFLIGAAASALLGVLGGLRVRNVWIAETVYETVRLGQCIGCGYTLVGLRASLQAVRCPECGEAAAMPPTAASVAAGGGA